LYFFALLMSYIQCSISLDILNNYCFSRISFSNMSMNYLDL